MNLRLPDNIVKYKVGRGDTLSAIARKFYHHEMFAQRIAEDNGIDDINLIYEGAILDIRNPLFTPPQNLPEDFDDDILLELTQ